MSINCHRLKTWPDFYAGIESGAKPFEFRRNDRGPTGFAMGDLLILDEYDPILERYTDRISFREITYTLHGPRPGLCVGWSILGLAKLNKDRWRDVGSELAMTGRFPRLVGIKPGDFDLLTSYLCFYRKLSDTYRENCRCLADLLVVRGEMNYGE